MPAFQYYLETSANDAIVSRSIQVFQAAQLFNPRVVKTSKTVAADVDQIRAVPAAFLNDDNTIQSLKDELPAYLAIVGNILDDFDQCSCGHLVMVEKQRCRNSILGLCCQENRALVQPLPAAAKRVFSLLVTMFGDQQHDALD